MKARIASLDVIRSLAIAAVVLIHSFRHFANPVLTGSRAYSTAFRVVGVIIENIGSMGVPLFVMLTGFLLLGRDFTGDKLKRFVKHNLLPMLVAFELWNIISFVVGKSLQTGVSVAAFIRSALFIGQGLDYLWYMHTIIGLYIGIPILAVIINRVACAGACFRRYAAGVLAIGAVYICVLPVINQILAALRIKHNVSATLVLSLIGGSVWVLYLLLGYCIRCGVFDKVSTGAFVCTLLLSFMLKTALYSAMLQNGVALFSEYESLLTVLAAFCVFVLVYRAESCFQDSPALLQITRFISTWSFGVYALHAILLRLDSKLSIIERIVGGGNLMLRILVLYVIVFGLSLIVVRLLGCIQPIRKWLLLAH